MSDKPKIGEVSAGTAITIGPVTHIIERISETDPGDVQKIAASQIELLTSYYDAVLAQAKHSFRWALIAAAIGLVFFLGAVGFLLKDLPGNVALISTIAGVVVETISGLNFFLYGRTTKQLAHYHNNLDRTQRFLLANSMCESLEGDERNRVRTELIRIIAGIREEMPENDLVKELPNQPMQSTR